MMRGSLVTKPVPERTRSARSCRFAFATAQVLAPNGLLVAQHLPDCQTKAGLGESEMTPQQFVQSLDAWVSRRGPIDFEIPRTFSITTTEEVTALSRALERGDIYAAMPRSSQALHSLVALVQGASTNEEISEALRVDVLPLLRTIAGRYLDGAVRGNRDDLLFALKVIASFQDPEDGPLISAALDRRTSRMSIFGRSSSRLLQIALMPGRSATGFESRFRKGLQASRT